MFYKRVRVVKLGEIKPTHNKVYWRKRHIGLKEKVIGNYNHSNGILISKDMKIIDGHHRHQILI
jgi:hypothetical protein